LENLMKIYRLIKIDMATGKTIAEESFEYAGPLALAVDGPSGTNGNDNRDSTDRSGESNSTKDVNSEDQKNFENTLNGDRNNNSNSKNKYEDCGCSLDDIIETEITYQDGTTRTEWHAPNGDFCLGIGPRPPGNNPSGGTFGVGNKGGHNNNDNSVYYDGTTTPSGTPSINLTKNDIPIGGDGISGLGGSSLGFGGGGGGVPFTSPGKEVGFHDLFRSYLQNSPTAQFATGLFAGGATGIAPGGFLADPFVDSLNYPQAFKIGYGLGQTTWGALEMLGGFGGHMLSSAFDASGIGAFAGIPGHVLSNAVGIEGAADLVAGYGVLRSAISNKNAGGVTEPQKIVNSLRDFKSKRFNIGNRTILLDKKGMKHILERHHPSYWNGSVKAKQSFFNPKTSLDDIQNLIGEVIKQNRDTIQKMSPNSMGSVKGTINGVEYQLGINKGRIGQFFSIQ
jgi:hypothetical protein